jgi:FHS family L-fucose permease-like MFS transporter
LGVYALAAGVLVIGAALLPGSGAVTALAMTSFFMSIMFPTIFALGIRGLGDHTKMGSSLIVMSIVGGAIIPPLLGWIADVYSMRFGYIVPLICFVFIAGYAAFWPALEKLDTGHEVAD